VFMDTTSLYFEGEGGATLGERGHSKDYRPHLNQIIVGVIIDQEGRPVCSEMWPGNTADVTTLIPVIDRLRSRFAIDRVCVVADRGMISAATIAALEQRGLGYILGVRERGTKEVRELIMADPTPSVPLVIPRTGRPDTELQAKGVKLGQVGLELGFGMSRWRRRGGIGIGCRRSARAIRHVDRPLGGCLWRLHPKLQCHLPAYSRIRRGRWRPRADISIPLS
jgi:hypothetical protein